MTRSQRSRRRDKGLLSKLLVVRRSIGNATSVDQRCVRQPEELRSENQSPEFCPNGERKLIVTRPRQGENDNNELLQSLFVDGRRVVPDERLLFTLPETYLCKLRGVNQTCIVFCPNNVDSLPELMSTKCPNWGGATAPLTPRPYAYVCRK